MTAPQRIQLRRTKDWRKPEGAIAVTRATRWGNRFKVGEHARDRAEAVALYVKHQVDDDLRVAARTELRGHTLACFCPLDEPCHADVLLAIANDPVAPGTLPLLQHPAYREGAGEADFRHRPRKPPTKLADTAAIAMSETGIRTRSIEVNGSGETSDAGLAEGAARGGSAGVGDRG